MNNLFIFGIGQDVTMYFKHLIKFPNYYGLFVAVKSMNVIIRIIVDMPVY